MNREFLTLLTNLTHQRVSFCLATVIEVVGSSSAPRGSKAIFGEDGQLLLGWVGGGCAQALVAHAALESLEDHRSRIVEVDLMDEIFGAGMPCGGHMRVFVEPFGPSPRLWLLGRGPLIDYLCQLASDMGFDVVIHDNGSQPQTHPRATRVIQEDHRYEQLLPDAEDFVVIATHHKGDLAALSRVLGTKASYIGLVASHHRAALIFEHLRKGGFENQQIKRIKGPAGLAIGSVTYREIALSIVAELVSLRRTRNEGVRSPGGAAG